MSMTDPAPAWQVTGQVPKDDTDASGTFGPGVRVSFRTASGLEDHLFVLRSDYTPERVRALIQAAVDAHDAIAGLTG